MTDRTLSGAELDMLRAALEGADRFITDLDAAGDLPTSSGKELAAVIELLRRALPLVSGDGHA